MKKVTDYEEATKYHDYGYGDALDDILYDNGKDSNYEGHPIKKRIDLISILLIIALIALLIAISI